MNPRRPFLLVTALLVASALLAAANASARAASARCGAGCVSAPAGSGALFVVSGHGWGHGVGLSQYGAYGYAQHGWTYDRIVAHYFPGTTLGQAPLSRIRVLLAEKKKALTVSSDADFRVRDGSGELRALPAGSYSLGPGLRLTIGDAAKPVALPQPLVFTAGSAPLQLGGKPYRGSLQVDVVDGKLRAIDVVGLEQYLYGVVPAEMPSNWSPEALKAQAVVARSYVLATRQVAAPFDVYADTRSQVYLGLSQERPSTNAAVDATAGQVVLYGGQVARTYFFSTSGGRTAAATEVWGGPPLPYLVPVADPYDTISPYHDWGPVAFTGARLAKAFGVPGSLTDAQPTLDASGRVASLLLLGTKGEVDVAGTVVRTKLRLRSTWFSLGMLALGRTAPVAPVEYGSPVRLSGVVRGVAQVGLEERRPGAAWQPAGPVTPAGDGTVALEEKPDATTDYRLVTGSVAAAPVRVAVVPRVRFYPADSAVELRGSVRPVLSGAPVQVQRQDASGATWTTVATAAVDAAGDFDAPLQLGAGVYRARVAAWQGLAAGTTPPLRVVSG